MISHRVVCWVGTARPRSRWRSGTVALRQPDVVRTALERRPMPDTELLLLRDAFDMLDEDMAEERFYLRMRQSYWNAADGSSARRFAETALRVLEF